MRTRRMNRLGSRLNRLTGAIAPPVASFTGTPLTIDMGTSQTCQFTDASSGAPTSWLWESTPTGAGTWTTFSTSRNPVVTAGAGGFTNAGNGIFDIRLTATNAVGSNTQTRLAYLAVTNSG